jgi:hypothetical protein
MREHRNPRPSVPNQPASHNFNPADALESLQLEITDIEAYAHALGEAIVDLNPPTNPEQRRIYKRVHTLINKLVEDVTTTVTHGDQHIAALSAHLAARRAAKADTPAPASPKP